MSLLQNRKFVFIVLNADKLKMKFAVWVLCIVLEISLLDYASSSSCQTLDRTLFTDCVQAGYNVSKFNPSRSPKELGLIASMQSKFKNCSSLSSLLTCSVQLSKCPTSTLPCKDVCKNFVSECQNSSSENDGLIALFRGICELLPSDKCSPKPNNVNNSASEAVKCKRLTIKQCQNAGYNFTSVSDAYQQMVESSAIFQNNSVNSTLRKLICMEIAPPCDAKNNQTLIVPCRSMCDDAFNESHSEFVKVFKAQKYCSTFPEFPENTTVDGKEHCTLQDWPDNGYWPSGLWASIATTGQQPNTPIPPTVANAARPPPTVNATTPVPTVNATTPAPTANATTALPTVNATTPAPTANATTPVPTPNATTPAPTANATTPVPTVNVTTPAPTANATTPVPTVNATTTAPTASATTPVPTVNVTMPAPTANATTAVPTVNATTPAPTTNATTPVPTVNATTPAPTANATTPVPTANATTPAPTANATTIAPTANATTPTPAAKTTTPAPTANATTPAPTAKTTTPAPTANATTPKPTANATTRKPTANTSTPVPTTNITTPVPKTNVTTPVPTANVTTPVPTTNGTTPAPTTKGTTPTPPTYGTMTETHKSSTSTSSTSRMKGSSPPVASASKGKKMSAGAIAGTVLGILTLLLAIVVGAICFRRYHQTKSQFRHSLMVDMDEL